MMGNIIFFDMSQAPKIRKKYVLLLVNKHGWNIQDTTVPSNMQFMNNRIQDLKKAYFMWCIISYIKVANQISAGG